MQTALVIGGGVAGLSCAQALAKRGWEVEIWRTGSRSSPTLLLNDITCYLLQDIWQLEETFWENFHVLDERRVCWGMEATVLSIPQPSVVMSGNCLVEHLEKRLQQHNQQVHFDDSLPSPDELASFDFWHHVGQKFTWVIDAGGRKSAIVKNLVGGQRYKFGQRCILSQEVMLTKASEQNVCWMETVPDGWMFLAPLGGNRAMLQCMVPVVIEEPQEMLTYLLGQTRFLNTFVDSLLGSTSVFEAFPQILAPLYGTKSIAVGDAAFSVDPISGDGTGYAIRGAILAASVINGIASGLERSQCLRHYTLRLHKTFFSHLQQCLNHYSIGFSSSVWKAEIELMQEVWQNNFDIPNAENFAYRLEELNLVPLPS
ncbi:NAD(P)/FAD-dependent oxidoreductase [Scytonema sp. PCC 10023]|uniref:NAD(P)/FAD-dependent oxidoreductase n=1 Tax=Scytonema sp. PCC 10023 TaxID=1680591 RepID=UPI0039C66298